MDRKTWLEQHAYLTGVAELQSRVDAAAEGGAPPPVVPTWDTYLPDHANGVPLLESERARIDLSGAAALLHRMATRFADGGGLPADLDGQAKALKALFTGAPEAAGFTVAWAVRGQGDAPVHAGLARFLAWNALRRTLSPLLAAYDGWRAGAAWNRAYCPTCGAAPAGAQLVAEAAGRARKLVCAQCDTRWSWQRLGCPHCGIDDPRKLEIHELEGIDEGLRIDACLECKGYVKTVTREPAEPFLLEEWATLHLDAYAKEKGLERRGASLFQM
jgi:FdhE protein